MKTTPTQEKPRWLNPEELDRLTLTWEIWASEAKSPERAVARARLHLFFLLARYAGMRSGEIASFDPHAGIDSQTGLLQIRDRRLFLPPPALRPLRRILTHPQSRDKSFLQLDPGFLRKSFYGTAKLAGLNPGLCAPRALRLARALELLAMHMPPHMVATCLDLPLSQVHSQIHHHSARQITNTFIAILTRLETGFRSARLLCQISPNISLQAICTLEDVANLEPLLGMTLDLHIPPGLIFPSRTPLPMANQIECEIVALRRDQAESTVQLALPDNLQILGRLEDTELDCVKLAEGDQITIYIPAHAISLRNPRI